MDTAVYGVTAMIHISVMLFAVGLLVFLYPINLVVSIITTVIFGLLALVYLFASALPLFDTSCPYRTPATYLMAYTYWLYLQSIPRLKELYLKIKPGQPLLPTQDTDVPVVLVHSSTRTTLADIMARSVAVYDRETFLSSSRFAFAWDRTSRYNMTEDAELRTLLELAVDIMSLNEPFFIGPNMRHMKHILADEAFMQHLQDYLNWRIFSEKEPDSRHPGFIIAQYFTRELLNLLTNDYKLLGLTERNTVPKSYISILGIIADMPIFEYNEIRIGLWAENARFGAWSQLCLFYVHQTIADRLLDSDLPIPDLAVFTKEMAQFYFSKHTLENLHPLGLLLFMHFHSSADRPGRYPSGSSLEAYNDWVESTRDSPTSTYLTPLHDDKCCKSWTSMFTDDGVAHDAASNILSIIWHVLQAPKEIQMGKVAGLELYLTCLSSSYKLSQKIIRKYMPSAEFIHILRVTGLLDTLEKLGERSDFDMIEPGPSENYHFLTTSSGWRVVNALGDLAQCVDWDAYHQGQQVHDGTAANSTQLDGLAHTVLTIPVTEPDQDIQHVHYREHEAEHDETWDRLYWGDDWPDDSSS